MASTCHRGGPRSLAYQQDCDYLIKAILLGDLGVGKTTFFHTYIHGRCPAGVAFPNTGTASGHKTISYHGKKVKLTVWDTAGQERYRSLTASYYRGAHACVVMYDVNNEDSFNNVTSWLESVEDYSDVSSGLVLLLVGTDSKGDNPSHCPLAVDRERAESLASHYQIPHFRVDCRHDPDSLTFVMDTLVTLVMTKAQKNKHLSHTIRPHSTTLDRLSHKGKTRGSTCSSCCT